MKYKVEQDLITIHKTMDLPLDNIRNKTILITGALGMLAAGCVDYLCFLNKEYKTNIKLVLLARSIKRLEKRWGVQTDNLQYIEQDITEQITYDEDINYVIHAAGNSSPEHIVDSPLNIIGANVTGSLNVLKLVKTKSIENLIFTSTREVYGKNETVTELKETDIGVFDPLDNRSCYPESKRMAENIFKSGYLQQNTPFNIVRIAHAYGPGMFLSDGRVMADLLGNIIDERDIALKSDGTAIRSFCYLFDAVAAMLLILFKGKPCEVYNLANECEEISIFDLANLLLKLSGSIKTVTRVNPKVNDVYCKYKRVSLNTDKIRLLGWSPVFELETGLKQTLDYFGE